MDPRVERLHPTVEHLREAGDRGHVGDGEPGLAERPRRAAGADELEAAGDEAQPRRGRDRSCRRPRGGPGGARAASAARAASIVTRRPSTRSAPASSSPTARGRSRCSTSWRRSSSVSSVSPARTGTASASTTGPPSRVSSTRWTVTPVTAAPAASASRTACAPGNAGRSDGWTLRTRPGEGAEEDRADEAHEAGKDDGVDLQRLQRRGQVPVRERATVQAPGSEALDEGRVDPGLGRPVEGGARAIGEDEGDLGVERAAVDPRRERPQVAAASRDPDRDPPAHPTHLHVSFPLAAPGAPGRRGTAGAGHPAQAVRGPRTWPSARSRDPRGNPGRRGPPECSRAHSAFDAADTGAAGMAPPAPHAPRGQPRRHLAA